VFATSVFCHIFVIGVMCVVGVTCVTVQFLIIGFPYLLVGLGKQIDALKGQQTSF
jgi:hypothetical protein